MKRLATLCSLALVTAGCQRGEQANAATSTVRDSGGVEIVESAVEQWTDATRWTLQTPPILDLGASESDTAQQFTMLRGVHRASDGSIAVFDAGSSSIRYFDTTGALVGRIGREGSGPGEFPRRSVGQWFACGGDTVLVSIQNRMAVFAAPGEYVREFTLDPVEGVGVSPAACLGNRLLVMYRAHPRRTTEGMHRDSVGLAWMDLEGHVRVILDTVGRWDRSYVRVGAEGLGDGQAPFGRRLAIAAGHGSLATSIGDRFEIEIRDTSGVLRRLVRVAGRDPPLTDADVQRYRDIVVPILEQYGEEGRVLDRQLARESLPRTKPAIAALRFDSEGHLWVRAYDMTDATEFYEGRVDRPRTIREPNRRWTVVGRDGRLFGDIAVPPRFEIHEIGDDWVLGIGRDSLDVEHVQLYRLHKP